MLFVDDMAVAVISAAALCGERYLKLGTRLEGSAAENGERSERASEPSERAERQCAI